METADTYSSIESLSTSDLYDMLDMAEHEERLLSGRRRQLQTAIDNAPDGPDRDEDVQRERAISDERLALHARITELRIEKSRRA